ncbi:MULTISPECIES: asparagine synthase (glutamine-hydrolyzing) [unclassified Lactobacillus]|uniref:asparagine synthase (glutamine-hydrolyzing) n=1 Tax=unclassified Lactobacillus TaxID=2620435 RepID=UPI000EFC2954|nr:MULTISPECIES: asparagine synthase (glutamine-hydrolyzing) [unclassified Lactobacillus]RMC38653.1 asparagine synthase (glutamine-hydrolyzing) [Lactobacillus sp. ESL0237]RMC42998.1 asparagine synthase (glutamine-hydrolyzing) [Lactobacillus sp. ESL0234]RMC43852.1 asparagine synthase (glutamine-hydrolyzing) [Lactobacillus sp. ESL0236]RMC44853.1 asparagine synthase (glutamine-hydrolyzing) [Lactobacillus sp. ESL0230]RMC48100.1 asparagine synthase (glutamine-hydrolyzing) [Lactobacillus sp. ESL0225
MCGIVAFYNPEINDKQAAIGKMMAAIKHRGPDSDGLYTNDKVALGFRRLSIIDLRGGSQPIFNEDKTRAIVFNGEIYNFKPLREELIEKGHTFTTKADTEVLLHGYEEWGMAELLKRIRGMFAFIIWDDNTQTMYGARDFFGIKPLYYSDDNGQLLMGSEIKSFLQFPGFKRRLNTEAVKPYLMNQYNDLAETFFKGIHRFPAGHWFEYKAGKMKMHQYWDAEYKANNLSFEETVNKIDEDLRETVELYHNADVPVGAFLSEGVDSSYITSILNPDDVFSISFDDATYDESSKAKALADIKGWQFFSDKVNADEAMHDFAEMQYHMDEPDANPSIIPLWYLCKMARKHVTVALSGEGADELFAGYVNYGMHTHNNVIKAFTNQCKKLPKKTKVKLAHKIKKMPNFPGKVHLYTNLAEPSEFYVGQSVIYDLDYPTIFTSQDANSILKPSYRNKLTVNGIYQTDFKKVKDLDNVRQMQYIDLHHFMLNDIEQKADKISMAHSLELRVPYLDKKIAQRANSIPTEYLVNKHDTKYALRKASEKVLPAEWAKRPKLGFPTPIKQWLQEPRFYKQVRELFSEAFVQDIFEQDKILQLLDDNYKGDGSHRRQIWTIYTFLVWYKLFFVDYDETVNRYQHVQPEVANLIEQGKLV